ncbi:MAG: hypothetical protein H0W74_12765 [Sphingosinicella sp.]|nr:hypothetical protein [Sphingosinicella sp.]
MYFRMDYQSGRLPSRRIKLPVQVLIWAALAKLGLLVGGAIAAMAAAVVGQ